MSSQDLELKLTHGLAELRSLLRPCSTYSVAATCFAYLLKTAHGAKRELMSPAKQIPFLLGVLVSTAEPESPMPFGEREWARSTELLGELFSLYMLLYSPTDSALGAKAREWQQSREVAMLAFINYFNNGLIASVQQIVHRIEAYLVPFDQQIMDAIGITATDALAIANWVATSLQETLDLAQQLGNKTFSGGAGQPLGDAHEAASKEFALSVYNAGTVSRKDLCKQFPKAGEHFWSLFSVGRGEGPQIRYPTEQSIAEAKPLIRFAEDRAYSPLANGVYVALLLTCERAILGSSAKDSYLRRRDKFLEAEVAQELRPFISSNAKVWIGAFEAPDSHFEHDTVVEDDLFILIVEAKASPPIEPFRDPDRAFRRLRDAFRAETGIQGAFDQGNRLASRLRAGETVALYDNRGLEIARLTPGFGKVVPTICVTRDNFGALATNLALLLEKSADDPYPWVVNVMDLANLGEAWTYLKWGPKEFRRYLERRIQLHGKVMSDDELDFAGYFIRHGGFDDELTNSAALTQLNPQYSDVFDDIYRHLHLEGPPVAVKVSAPVRMDLRRSLKTGKAAFVESRNRRVGGKVGRNERCPCGSGKNFKHCHGSK
jgi:hypothetical protein